MKLSMISLFPEYFDGLINTSIVKRGLENGLFEFETINPRDFSTNKHRHVDDTPYGGGQGMVLQCEPIVQAIRSVQTPESRVILLSPQGRKFDQGKANELAKEDHLIFVCGHYEGFDERIRDYVDEQVSLGDFVMTGGEPAAAAISDSIIRLLPGVIRESSFEQDSFQNHLLEYPQYTKPYEFEGKKVPDVLISGHHANIEKWRNEMSLLSTWLKRHDLLERYPVDDKNQEILERLILDWVEKNPARPFEIDLEMVEKLENILNPNSENQ